MAKLENFPLDDGMEYAQAHCDVKNKKKMLTE